MALKRGRFRALFEAPSDDLGRVERAAGGTDVEWPGPRDLDAEAVKECSCASLGGAGRYSPGRT